MRAAIADMRREAVASGDFAEPASVKVSEDGTVASVQLPIAGGGTDDRSTDGA